MDLHNENNNNHHNNMIINHHSGHLPPIINDAPLQQQHYRQEHENIQNHHLIQQNNSNNNNNNNNSSNSGNNYNSNKSSSSTLSLSSSSISSQIDKVFQNASSMKTIQNKSINSTLTNSNNTNNNNNNNNNNDNKYNNNYSTTTTSYNETFQYNIIEKSINNNSNYNNNTNNNNNNNNSNNNHHHSHHKEKKSSKNSFYDLIDEKKRKLSDLDDYELDNIVESFGSKKNSSGSSNSGSSNGSKKTSGSSSSNSSSIKKSSHSSHHRENVSGSSNGGSESNKKNIIQSSSNNNSDNSTIKTNLSLSSPSNNSTSSTKTATLTETSIQLNKTTTSTTDTITPASISTPTTTSTSTTVTTTTNDDDYSKLEFAYSLSSLNWDIDHLNNKENIYCYCGKGKERIMIRCDLCKQMFHVGCIKLLQGSHLYGDWVYRFSCSVCSDGNETFERFSKNWGDILEITLFNLQQNRIDQLEKWEKKSPNTPSTFACIKTNLSEESNMDEINFNNIKNNTTSILKKGIYFHLDDEIIPFIEKNWNLLCSDKKKKSQWNKPLLPALTTGRIFKSGFINYSKKNMWALGTDQLLLKDNSMYKDVVLAPLHKKRKKKKSTEEEKRDKELTRLLLVPSNVSHFVPTIEYDILCIAKENSAPQIKLIDNHFLTVANDEGYRMARSSFPCICGNWFFEIEILNSDGNSRLGWSTPKGDCQANVGYDQFSYAYRNLQGDIIHNARAKPYGEPYGKGDVIGFYICLPEVNSTQNEKDFPFINQLDIYDMVSNEYSHPQDQPLKDIIPNSFIQFFKNGISPGPAFTNIGKGSYYPSASMYMKSMVKFNFGPNFKFPPTDLNYKPFCYIIKNDK